MIVQVGNPITISYKRIKIVSDNFNKFGTTNVMITTTIKTVQTKEKIMESITYYDKDVKPLGNWNDTRSHVITKFDPTEYGNSVCYYNPGYGGNNINIATKFWNISDSNCIEAITSFVKGIINLSISTTPIAPYISLVDGIIDNTRAILISIETNELLEETHLTSFSGSCDEEPFLMGTYVCLPTINNSNDIKNIIKNYCVSDATLMKKSDPNTCSEEFSQSYFIFDVSCKERSDLKDFDFTASSNELLKNLYKNSTDCINDFIKISNESKDLNIIKQIHELSEDNISNKGLFNSLYNHLTSDSKILVRKLYPNLTNHI